jgi:hypothetical protein
MVHGAHLFFLSIDAQADLEPAAEVVTARNGTKFSQCSVAWGGFPWARVSGCQKFDLVDALFPLDGGRRREGNKEKNHHAGRGFPWHWIRATACVMGHSFWEQLKADFRVSL